MTAREKNVLRRITDKVYGGLKMSWPVVILYAVGTAVLTAIFLLVPVFKDTSFHRMGETFEAWIFFAIIIIANCKKPLESALKTFVFFLISQPLIYLFRVPFSPMGWGLFGYYRYWAIWTALTFPMAFVGWYIKKKNWLSLLILSPILFSLTNDYVGGIRHMISHFPYLLVLTIFCLGQVFIYLYTFTKNIWQKLVGFLVPLAVILVLLLVTPQIYLESSLFLPDEPVLTENSVVVMEENDGYSVSIERTGQDSRIKVHAYKYGTTRFVIRDGEKEYGYIMEVYEDENGSDQIKLTPE